MDQIHCSLRTMVRLSRMQATSSDITMARTLTVLGRCRRLQDSLWNLLLKTLAFTADCKFFIELNRM